MSSTSSVPFLVLDLAPSRWLLFGLGFFHLLALSSLFVMSLPWWIKLSLGVLIGGSAWLNYSRYGDAQSTRFISRIQRTADGQWLVCHADGREYAARLIGSYVHPQLVVLNFRFGRWNQRSAIVPPDSAPYEQIRRLRVYLRTTGDEENDEPDDTEAVK
ncbi:MAG: hypothetical protein HC808_06530 [Candidatus Competibacteraceae bacterium]|nr:hypothetical protein [Candidatus Competibacteraceae bacterium]